MHPILRHWRRFLLWLAAWLPLGAILVMVVRLSALLSLPDSVTIVVPATVLLAFFCLAPYYVCRSLPLRSASPARIAVPHIASAFILSGVVMLVARLIASVLSPAAARRFPAAAPALAVIVLMIYLMAVALHYAALEMESSRRAEVLAREAQLRALKSQVNPHFLFNCLNSISALTAIDAAEAREMCIRLADFLRTSLRLGERVTVPFAEEMELTAMYLDVERVRFGGKLRLAQRLDPACSACDIPALLIQPLVENAVKHGIAMMAEGGEIAISGECDGQWLRFSISNPFDPEAPPAGRGGLGLRNVRERLDARYGGAARMDIRIADRTYLVALTLPAKAAP